MENKAKQNSKTKGNPGISAYGCSPRGKYRYISPVNTVESQLNSWSYSELQQNATEYQNLKIKEKLFWNSRALTLCQCSLPVCCGETCSGLSLLRRALSSPPRWHFCFKIVWFLYCKFSSLQQWQTTDTDSFKAGWTHHSAGLCINWASQKEQPSTKTLHKHGILVGFLHQYISFLNWGEIREFGRDALS